MNEQAGTMMNPQQQQQFMNMNMNMNQMMNMSSQPPPIMNPPQQPQVMNFQNSDNPSKFVPNSGGFLMSSQPRSTQIMNRSYGMWAPPLGAQPQFQNPNQNPGVKPPYAFNKLPKPLGPRSNWKGKKVGMPMEKRRKDQQLQQPKSLILGASSNAPAGVGNVNVPSGGGNPKYSYNPPTLNELQNQNRLKARKFFPRKKFNKNNSMNTSAGNNVNKSKNRFAPYAPRNTSSFIIRAKKSGGIASLVSPCPVTPAVLPTPMFSPSREVLVDMAKEEWGVDGYGSMKGLIRLRSPGHEDEEDGGSSESDVEEHVEVERRLDHDLSRFEMIYNPSSAGGMEYNNILENRVDDQDTHIAQLEEENLILKERLFLMERELEDLRRRLHCLERQGHEGGEYVNEEVMENESENESDSRGEEPHSIEENNEDLVEEDVEGHGISRRHEEDGQNNEMVVGTERDEQDKLSNIARKQENISNGSAETGKNGDAADVKEMAEETRKNETGKADESGRDTDVERKEESPNDPTNKTFEVRAEDNASLEASNGKSAGDISVEEVGDADDKLVVEKDAKE